MSDTNRLLIRTTSINTLGLSDSESTEKFKQEGTIQYANDIVDFVYYYILGGCPFTITTKAIYNNNQSTSTSKPFGSLYVCSGGNSRPNCNNIYSRNSQATDIWECSYDKKTNNLVVYYKVPSSIASSYIYSYNGDTTIYGDIPSWDTTQNTFTYDQTEFASIPDYITNIFNIIDKGINDLADSNNPVNSRLDTPVLAVGGELNITTARAEYVNYSSTATAVSFSWGIPFNINGTDTITPDNKFSISQDQLKNAGLFININNSSIFPDSYSISDYLTKKNGLPEYDKSFTQDTSALTISDYYVHKPSTIEVISDTRPSPTEIPAAFCTFGMFTRGAGKCTNTANANTGIINTHGILYSYSVADDKYIPYTYIPSMIYHISAADTDTTLAPRALGNMATNVDYKQKSSSGAVSYSVLGSAYPSQNIGSIDTSILYRYILTSISELSDEKFNVLKSRFEQSLVNLNSKISPYTTESTRLELAHTYIKDATVQS